MPRIIIEIGDQQMTDEFLAEIPDNDPQALIREVVAGFVNQRRRRIAEEQVPEYTPADTEGIVVEVEGAEEPLPETPPEEPTE